MLFSSSNLALSSTRTSTCFPFRQLRQVPQQSLSFWQVCIMSFLLTIHSYHWLLHEEVLRKVLCFHTDKIKACLFQESVESSVCFRLRRQVLLVHVFQRKVPACLLKYPVYQIHRKNPAETLKNNIFLSKFQIIA